VSAPPAVVWDVLLAACPRPQSSGLLRLWALVWGAEPSASNGLGAQVIGAERPGLAVREVVPATTWAAAGRHRFAVYQVVFRITPAGVGTRLTVETYATFPGAAGRAYRAVVVHAGPHTIAMRATLWYLRRRAEAVRMERVDD
jgi:hypothetical protein